MVLLFSPVFVLNGLIFFAPSWYYQDQRGAGFAALLDHAAADIHNALARTSWAHLRSVTDTDDLVLREVRRLASVDSGNTLIICASSPTSWRKVAYYFPELPVLVLDRRQPAGPAEYVAAVWRGPKLEHRIQGPAPLELPVPAAKRIIWLVRPGADFFRMLTRSLAVVPSGPVFTWSPPQREGSSRVGEYVLMWQNHT
jgi:hypothetical protein